MFRHLKSFRALYESEGIEEITGADGTVWCLWDVEYLYEQSQVPGLLPPRQRQAIRLCLVENMLEKEAATAMGVSQTNPVAMYATDGLRKLITFAESGRFPRFRPDVEEATG